MPVKWSPLAVSRAADIIEEHLNNASAPLELAREEVAKALGIPGIPGYMEQRLKSIDCDLADGINRYKSKVEGLRRDLPKDQLKQEEKMGDRVSLLQEL